MQPPLRLAVRAGFTPADQAEAISGVRDGRVGSAAGWEWDWILHGLAVAIERYRAALGIERALVARVGAGEALWWVCSADEYLRNRVGGDVPARLWYPDLEKTPAGAMLAGLVYARNKAGHRQAQLLAIKADASANYTVKQPDGSSRGGVVTASITTGLKPDALAPEGGFVFESLDSLAGDDITWVKPYGRDRCYDEHAAGNPVLEVLEQVLKALRATLRFERPRVGELDVKVKGCHFLSQEAAKEK